MTLLNRVQLTIYSASRSIENGMVLYSGFPGATRFGKKMSSNKPEKARENTKISHPSGVQVNSMRAGTRKTCTLSTREWTLFDRTKTLRDTYSKCLASVSKDVKRGITLDTSHSVFGSLFAVPYGELGNNYFPRKENGCAANFLHPLFSYRKCLLDSNAFRPEHPGHLV
jgi:hypothetical protein